MIFKDGNIYYADFSLLPITQGQNATDKMRKEFEVVTADMIVPVGLECASDRELYDSIDLSNDANNVFDVISVSDERDRANRDFIAQYSR